MNNWLDNVVAIHKDYEAPLSFWRWSALAAISAVVKDNVWLDRYIFKQYPNIYVILYADSGLKKGAPISMARTFVENVNSTKVVNGRSSIQAIMKEIATAQSEPGGKIVGGATGFIVASELSASIVEDPAAFNILTDLFDRSWNESKYTSLLKPEKFVLKKPTISLLAGINKAHAEAMFANKDIEGGFLGRCFVIHESKRNAINSLVKRPEKIPDYKALSEYLKDVAKLKGQFKEWNDTPAGKYFDEWYKNFMQVLEKQQVEDPTGTLNRFSESVCKIAMLLSLAEKPELVISEEAVVEAVRLCEGLVGNIRKTTLGSGSKSQWAQHKVMLLLELLRRDNHMISREHFMKKYWVHANTEEWDKIIQTMEAGGHIKIDNHGSAVIIYMPEASVEVWTKQFAGKI